jgi:hypothetical protein
MSVYISKHELNVICMGPRVNDTSRVIETKFALLEGA